MRYILLAVSAILICSACTKKEKTLFQSISSDKSGITFSNSIVENEQLNMINYQYLYNGGGVGIGDFNNDSLPDIYFTGSLVDNKLYLNRGNFKFEDVTDQAGVTGEKKWSRGATVVDINNDGLLDIYVCAAAWQSAELKKDILYVNQGVNESTGIPKFRDMAKEYGLVDTASTHMAAFFDYDNDGDLDLYLVVNDLNMEFPSTFRKIKTDGSGFTNDILYRNDFDSKLQHPIYTNVTKEAGITWEGNGLGINILDINNDGWKDIYVSNDYLSGNLLYINNKNGTFTNRNADYFKHGSLNAMGNDAGDINNDGLVDIVEMDMKPEDNYRQMMMMNATDYNWYTYSTQYNFPYQTVRNTLQLNQGPRLLKNDTIGMPIFSEIAYYAGIPYTDWSWGALLVDADNDGYKDLMTTNGLPKDVTDLDFIAYRDAGSGVTLNDALQKLPALKINNYIFRNNGDITFTDKTNEWGWNFPTYSSGIAYADFDRDGDMDVVINNTNMEASLLENNANTFKEKRNYINLKFRGDTSNINGIGTVVHLFYKNQQQIGEATPYRGYMSSVENTLHFGLDSITTIDSIVLYWPGTKKETLTNIAANQTLLLIQSSTSVPTTEQPLFATGNWFTNSTSKASINFEHKEDSYVEFSIQRQLPHKYSQYGPSLATGDLNGDKLIDVVVGGTAPYPALIFYQKPGEKFAPEIFDNGNNIASDQTSICIFDADNDKDLDLYFASGGYELTKGAAGYADLFYRNDGKGNFTKDSIAIPLLFASKSCVKNGDYDGDGDQDLFIGGRIVPGEYPKPESGYLLRNDLSNGVAKFTLVTNEIAPGLQSIGMINDAVWADADKDGDPDLLVTGEWMGLYFLKNENGKLVRQKSVTDTETGWWNCITSADIDKDGDVDFIAGNFGNNGYYNGTVQEPVTVYANDFDNNNRWDAFLTVWRKDSLNGTKKEFPALQRDVLAEEIPSIKKLFADYRSFARADAKTVMTNFNHNNEIKLSAINFKTVWIENKGNFEFVMHALPAQAQWSPVFGILANDFNGDGAIDLLLSGNEYNMSPLVGRDDALNGLVLKGDGKGNFQPLSILESGIYIPGNGRGLVQFPFGKSNAVLASQNNGSLQLFQQKK